VSSLQTQASLIVATFQLLEVQSVLGAIHRADAESAADRVTGSGYWPYPAAVYEPLRYAACRPAVYECCRHICPPPIYKDPCVIHTQPRVEQQMLCCLDNHSTPPAPSSDDPFQPPWKVVPWEIPPQPRQTIKIHPPHTDVNHRGMLLDLFV
jgi:hypothetical protein